MKVLIVTPMQEELMFFLRSCLQLGYRAAEHSAIGKVATANLPGLGVTIACGGTGKAQFALQTQHLLDTHPDWDAVICSGALI